MKRSDLHKRLERIGVKVNDSTIYSWMRTLRIKEGPLIRPIERDETNSRRFKKKGYKRGQTGDWSDGSLLLIAAVWSLRNPQDDRIKPLAFDRIINVYNMASSIERSPTTRCPLDWGVPNFHESYHEVVKTERWLVSDELHPYVVRLLCMRQKLGNEIDVTESVKVNYVWKEEFNEYPNDLHPERIHYSLQSIALDRNVELDAVEIRVIPLGREANHNELQPNNNCMQDKSVIFRYDIWYTLAANYLIEE